jgi:hypothetical protein
VTRYASGVVTRYADTASAVTRYADAKKWNN